MSTIIPPTILLLFIILSSCHTIFSDCDSCHMHQYITLTDQKFEQKSKKFWHFSDQSTSWVEVQLPYDLISCIDSDCTVVNSIQESNTNKYDHKERDENRKDDGGSCSNHGSLPVRKRISLTKMSETSVWVTGESGSIYERFWNGLQWVIAPHDLPLSAGYAVSVFMVNQTILALSEAGLLYQMQLTEESQPIWVEFDKSQSSEIGLISSGVVSNDRERVYLCSRSGVVLEVAGVDPPSVRMRIGGGIMDGHRHRHRVQMLQQ